MSLQQFPLCDCDTPFSIDMSRQMFPRCFFETKDGRDGPKRAVAYRKAQSPTIPSSQNLKFVLICRAERINSRVDESLGFCMFLL